MTDSSMDRWVHLFEEWEDLVADFISIKVGIQIGRIFMKRNPKRLCVFTNIRFFFEKKGSKKSS